MAVEINIVYDGGLRCTATHGPSKVTLQTDAPADNAGRGESFSPTDLVATGLGCCVMTIMGILADRAKLDIAGTRVHVEKHMSTEAPRRIARLPVTVTVPASKAAALSENDRTRLENGARHCPVHHSLHPDIDAPITFVYET
jgi:putative redox protein